MAFSLQMSSLLRKISLFCPASESTWLWERFHPNPLWHVITVSLALIYDLGNYLCSFIIIQNRCKLILNCDYLMLLYQVISVELNTLLIINIFKCLIGK